MATFDYKIRGSYIRAQTGNLIYSSTSDYLLHSCFANYNLGSEYTIDSTNDYKDTDMSGATPKFSKRLSANDKWIKVLDLQTLYKEKDTSTSPLIIKGTCPSFDKCFYSPDGPFHQMLIRRYDSFIRVVDYCDSSDKNHYYTHDFTTTNAFTRDGVIPTAIICVLQAGGGGGASNEIDGIAGFAGGGGGGGGFTACVLDFTVSDSYFIEFTNNGNGGAGGQGDSKSGYNGSNIYLRKGSSTSGAQCVLILGGLGGMPSSVSDNVQGGSVVYANTANSNGVYELLSIIGGTGGGRNKSGGSIPSETILATKASSVSNSNYKLVTTAHSGGSKGGGAGGGGASVLGDGASGRSGEVGAAASGKGAGGAGGDYTWLGPKRNGGAGSAAAIMLYY